LLYPVLAFVKIELCSLSGNGLGDCLKKNIPDCAGFLFGFKARRRAHSELCTCRRNAEAAQKDQQNSMFFDRNRLSVGEP
jgi:hypothetical protein